MSLIFDQKKVSKKKETEAVKLVVRPGEYQALNCSHLSMIAERLAIQVGQLCSIRNQYVQFHVMRGTHKIKGIIWDKLPDKPDIKKILSFSRRYDYPPVLAYKIRYGKGNGKDKGKKDRKEPGREKFLSELEEHDAFFGPKKLEMIAKNAAAFEASVVEIFKQSGVDVRTQEELVKEQTEKYGRPVATPDLLFKEPVLVNGRKITWVDAKNFYAADVPFVRKSLKEQSEKYNKYFGPGAFMFRYGFSENYKDSPEVMYLSP